MSSHLNIEFKARCADPINAIAVLQSIARYVGEDHQIDTYFLETPLFIAKFHVDSVAGLESAFVEVEIKGVDETIRINVLQEACKYYKFLLNVKDGDLVSESYSDLLKVKQ